MSIERDYDPSLPSGRFDRNEIIQALLNVARNALQALAGSGRLVLRTRALSNMNIGPVAPSAGRQHSGRGRRPRRAAGAARRRCSSRWSRAKAEGTGLGLAVAQEMVARHRGIIEFESRPGHTVFSLLLPLEDAA